MATEQHGVVARRQLRSMGLGPGAINFRLEIGRLHVLFRGTYAVGHRDVSREGMRMAATLTYGEDAALSHFAAGAHWPLLPGARGLHVTVPRRVKPRPRVTTHHLPLAADEVTVHDGIPITTPARTIFDLGIYGRRTVERAIHEAEHQKLYDRLSLEDLLRRYPGRKGAEVIRSVLRDPRPQTAATANDFEEDFVAWLEAEGFPLSRVNEWIRIGDAWIKPDCVFAEERVIVELDGGTHLTRLGRRKDDRRDAALQAAGWRVMRVTWDAFYFTRGEVAADLRALLKSSRGTFVLT